MAQIKLKIKNKFSYVCCMRTHLNLGSIISISHCSAGTAITESCKIIIHNKIKPVIIKERKSINVSNNDVGLLPATTRLFYTLIVIVISNEYLFGHSLHLRSLLSSHSSLLK